MKAHLRRCGAVLVDRQIRLIAVLGSMALLWACYPVVDTTYSNPQEAGTGQWLIEFRTGEEKVHIEMRYERKTEKGTSSHSHGFMIDPVSMSGLMREQAMSAGSHVQFQLKRDAGTFNFEGWFKEGNGSGHFTFAPDHTFAAQLTSQGYGSPTDEQLLSLASIVEAEAKVFGDGAGLRSVIERHHEDADEDHGGDGADPVEVAGDDAVLGARGSHADDFLGAEVGGDEGEAADPGWDGTAGEEKIIAGAHVALEGEADAQHKDKVDQHDEPVDDGKSHGSL